MSVKIAKKPKNNNKTIQIKASELSKQKEALCLEATQRSTLLCLAAAKDVLNLDEDKLCEVMETVSLYARHYDNHVIEMADVAESLRQTGIDINVEEIRCAKRNVGIQLLAKRRITL